MYFTSPTPTYDTHFALLEPLIQKYQVDLVLTGHVHNAMVTCPVVNQVCHKPATPGGYDAPVYVVTGNAGQSLSPIGDTADWIVYQAMEFGYSTLMMNKTNLHMELHRDADDSIHYQFDIYRSYPRQ